MKTALRTLIAYSLMGAFILPVGLAQDPPTSEDYTRIVELEPVQQSTGENGELQLYLNIGEVAPFSGVLLNPPAVAFVLAETQALWGRGQLALQRQRAIDAERLRLETELFQLEITSLTERYYTVTDGMEREIARGRQLHQALIDENHRNSFWNGAWGTFLKMLAGAAIGISLTSIVVGLTI